MTEPITTYTIKSKNTSNIWEFKYDLNGFLKEFKIIEGQLNKQQIEYLFHPLRFPYLETTIEGWKKIQKVEVIIGKPDLSFDTFWRLYNYKAR